MAVVITKENLETEINQSQKPVIVKVYATWCGPCQQMNPIFDELEKEFSNAYAFAELNVDDARDISIQYGITSVPTFLFIKNGEVVGRETGFINKDDLINKINEYLG